MGAIAFFVVAGTIALSVALRWRNLALLRAVGATPGQVRRMIWLELAVLGAVAGLAAYLPGLWLANWALRGLAAHQLLPPSPHVWTSPLVVLIAAGAGIVFAEIAGVVSVRRVSRIRPAAALSEATVGPRLIHPVRLLLGLCALGGGAAMCILMTMITFSTNLIDTFAIFSGLLFLIAIALLGPVLVSLAELLVRFPLLLVSGVGGRLALADIRRRPRRMAAAVSAVALGVAFVGANYLIDVTQTHGAVVQGGERLVADAAVSAPGPGLAPAALPAIASQPGVSTAVGLTPTTVFVPYPGNDCQPGRGGHPRCAQRSAEPESGLGKPRPLRSGRHSAQQGHHRPQCRNRESRGHDSYLPGGRDPLPGQGGRDLLPVPRLRRRTRPGCAAGGGHLGSATLGEVLVRGAPGVAPVRLSSELAGLAARFPGLSVASRSVVNAQAQVSLAQQSYGKDLFLGTIVLLAAVALVNTLVMATVERRGALFLLRRVGATTRQLLSMTIWQTVILDLTGLILGAAAGAASVAVVSKQLAGTWMPYLTWPPMAVIGASVVGLTIIAILTPTLWLLTSPIRDE